MRLLMSLVLAMAAAAAAPAGEDAADRAGRSALTEAGADNLAERAGRADAVVVAEARKVAEGGLAECRVVSALKGGLKVNATFRVRFSRVYGGAWPEKGVTAVYFLKSPPSGGRTGLFRSKPPYNLISDTEGLAPPTADRIAVLQLAAAGKYVKSSGCPAVRVELPAPNTLEGMVIDASYVAAGAIQEVSLTKLADCAAVLDFRVEKVYKGELDRGRIFVRLPEANANAISPDQKPLTPKVGPAVLMFLREGPGGAYRLISPFRGCLGAAGPEALKELDEQLVGAVEKEQRLRRQGLVGNPGDRDTVAGTILAWQRSWEAKEITNVIACYSRQSPWRRKWESGPEGRRELAKVLEAYPAHIEVICDRVEQQEGKDRVAAHVRIRVISQGNFVEIRPAVMAFAFENGQWLIVDEGG
jgi:hypothetical protein